QTFPSFRGKVWFLFGVVYGMALHKKRRTEVRLFILVERVQRKSNGYKNVAWITRAADFRDALLKVSGGAKQEKAPWLDQASGPFHIHVNFLR
ncbi:MAG: hypothetical protein J6T24_00775, partial [Clostridia bacterium]|nr:hypothetical protein [Clostridia bacterium]